MEISVIIPTQCEAESIERLINFVKQHGNNTVKEIIVVDASSADNTAGAARAAGAIVVNSHVASRAAQMNLGAAMATSPVLFFVHADTTPVSSFCSDIQDSIQSGYDAGCYRYIFDSPKRMLRINAWFTRFDRLMFRGGDQTLFIRKEVFDHLGGFDEYHTIMEDYDFLIRLRKVYRFKIVQKDIVVSARKYSTNSWLRVQVANLMAFTMFRIGIHPNRIKKTYKKMLIYR